MIWRTAGHVLVGMAALCVAIEAWQLWPLDVALWKEICLAFGGLVAYAFPDEVSSWSGRQGWRSTDWRFQPAAWVRLLGLAAFLVAAVAIFRH